MLSSMTGFATGRCEAASVSVSAELRSVNSRYLEIHFRIADELRVLEPRIRERITAAIRRGKVECRVTLTRPAESAIRAPVFNGALADSLRTLEGEVRARFPGATPLTVVDVLRFPGMLGEPAVDDAEALETAGMRAVAAALTELVAARRREGEALAVTVGDRLRRVEAVVAEVAPRMPALIAAHAEKLAARLREVMAAHDEERVRQELAMFAQKVDVDEEIDRLTTHVRETRRVVETGGEAGKRLDFLMQEMNREANTLASKSVATEVSQAALDLKVLIEQMREQVQNIE